MIARATPQCASLVWLLHGLKLKVTSITCISGISKIALENSSYKEEGSNENHTQYKHCSTIILFKFCFSNEKLYK